MQSSILTRSAVLALLVAGLACAGNSSSNTDVGAAKDSSRTRAATTDSVANQSDSGQPVTAKVDTVHSRVDSSTTAR